MVQKLKGLLGQQYLGVYVHTHEQMDIDDPFIFQNYLHMNKWTETCIYKCIDEPLMYKIKFIIMCKSNE